jgi:hypothetical protein
MGALVTFRSIAEVPIPPDLSDLDRIEYLTCRDALAQLEWEWLGIETGENPDLRACLAIIDEAKANRNQLADERLALRIETINAQVAQELQRIAVESEEAKNLLRDRIFRGYFQSYQEICEKLKELMPMVGMDFDAFLEGHAIEFPPLPPDTQMKTRLQVPAEVPVQVSAEDCERDLRAILETYGGSE